MNLSIYLQTDFIPFLVLCIIFINSSSKFASIPNIKRFQILILLVLGSLSADAFTWYLLAHNNAYTTSILWSANIIYFIFASGTSFFWFLYVYYQINGENLGKAKEKRLHLYVIPFVFLCIIIVLSLWNHALFYIDPLTKTYERGFAHLLFSFCIIGYILVASILAVIAVKKEVMLSRKKELRILCYAAFFPILGFILQMINPNLIFLWPCTSVGICILYLDFQQQKISIDSLTSLNNRKNLEKYLHVKMTQSEPSWYFIMIDADRFKDINDKFGHIEGDRALKIIAQALKQVLGSTSAFISRYGGDEFAVITDATNDLQIELFIQSFRDEIWNLSRMHELRYDIQVSVGYAKFIDLDTTPPLALVKLADEKMYKNKTLNK